MCFELALTFLDFEKVMGINTQMYQRQIFFQVIMFHCILLSYNWKAFQNSFFIWKYVLWEENYEHFESLDWIIQSTKCRLHLNLLSLLFLTPIYLPCGSTDHRDTLLVSVVKSLEVSKCTNRTMH